jgi:hypothetical protein
MFRAGGAHAGGAHAGGAHAGGAHAGGAHAGGAASAIDHFAVTQSLYGNIHDVKVVDSGINLSDHCPLVLDISVPHTEKVTGQSKSLDKKVEQLNFRWDQGDVMQYYLLTRDLLNAINAPIFLLSDYVQCRWSYTDIATCMNQYYNCIVNALYNASCSTIPRKKHSFYKYWWDEELTLLKDKAIQSFNTWTAVGKPRTGVVFDVMRRDKATYKLAIKTKQQNSVNEFSDSLNDALLHKDMESFWKSWKSKFGSKGSPSVIDGCCGEDVIAEKFAMVFESVSVPNSADRHRQLESSFFARFSNYDVSDDGYSCINVELVQKCIDQLKKGKAAGIDGLTAEHISLAHPILAVHLSLLFNILLVHNLVPDAFGHGVIIPLLKNPDGNQFVSDNYRGITLSPVISKLFEMVLIRLYDKRLASDTLQFGFKQNSSCKHALFTLRTVIDHYVKDGSTVNICALDISKAFDRVDHFALLQLLIDRQLPRNFIGVLLDWFTKCAVCVRWGGALSYWFRIFAGVRQGGVLSPILFAVYMDVLIVRLKQSGLGCKILDSFYGCLLYADDILLLSHSVNAMRQMLLVCEQFAVEFDVKFNSSKSVALRIGNRYNAQCAPFILAGEQLKYVKSVKYLGIYLVASSHFKTSVEHLKIKFYRVFNCIYSKSKAANSEMITVELLKTYCLPFLLYASEAVLLSATNMQILDNCVNRALYKIFGVSSSDCLQTLRCVLGLTSIKNLVEQRRLKFVTGLINIDEYVKLFLIG